MDATDGQLDEGGLSLSVKVNKIRIVIPSCQWRNTIDVFKRRSDAENEEGDRWGCLVCFFNADFRKYREVFVKMSSVVIGWRV